MTRSISPRLDTDTAADGDQITEAELTSGLSIDDSDDDFDDFVDDDDPDFTLPAYTGPTDFGEPDELPW